MSSKRTSACFAKPKKKEKKTTPWHFSKIIINCQKHQISFFKTKCIILRGEMWSNGSNGEVVSTLRPVRLFRLRFCRESLLSRWDDQFHLKWKTIPENGPNDWLLIPFLEVAPCRLELQASGLPLFGFFIFLLNGFTLREMSRTCCEI